MNLNWRYADPLGYHRGPEHWRLCRCGGPRLPDGRCVVSGHRSAECYAGDGNDNRERIDWMRQPNENRDAMERVREARREYNKAMKESRP